MARTAALYAFPALVVALNWGRLESPGGPARDLLLVALLALAPALVRPLRLRIGVGILASLGVAGVAFHASVFDARPFDGRHDFFGPLLGRFGDGFLDFYDYALPIDPGEHPLMHGVLLTAIFAACLALALGIAARRPLPAVLALVVGAGWPATLLTGGGALLRGAFILAAALVLLAGLHARDGSALGRALPAGAALVLCALVASSSPAVAKSELLRWQRWDFYDRPQAPVSVSYVWNSSYVGIRFPKKKTTVLRIAGPPDSLYWRATTLDEFDGRGWVEGRPGPATRRSTLPVPDPFLPAEARRGKHVLKERVTVEALRDPHLVAASLPIAYRFDASAAGGLRLGPNGVALAGRPLPRDTTYETWSYAPEPSPAQLAKSPADYPPALLRRGYLDVVPGIATPPFGAPEHDRRVQELFRAYPLDDALTDYEPLFAQARRVVGRPTNPYAATLALETWFRRLGGFRYDEHPRGTDYAAPLAEFVTRTRRGYCQHFAGAMALMLRYLGIPARVAAGFTSGSYDSKHGTWKVTDHDAHAWVEAWFSGYGWLPFDPTPGRGTLTSTYTAASPRFDSSTARRLLLLAAAGVAKVTDPHDFNLDLQFGAKGADLVGGADVRRGSGRGGGVSARGGGRGASLLRLLALLALALLATIALAKLVLRRGRYLTGDPRRLAAACRRELADFLADQGVQVPASASLEDLARIVAEELAVDAAPFVDAVNAARFGPPEGAGAAAARARRELRELERRLRTTLTRAERARGLVSLRSLGFSS